MPDVKVSEVGDLSDQQLAWLALTACEEITRRICHDERSADASMRAICSILAIEDLRAAPAETGEDDEQGT